MSLSDDEVRALTGTNVTMTRADADAYRIRMGAAQALKRELDQAIRVEDRERIRAQLRQLMEELDEISARFIIEPWPTPPAPRKRSWLERFAHYLLGVAARARGEAH